MNSGNFNRISIIGLGFMGMALAKALKTLYNDIFIGGFDIDKNLLELLLKKNIINKEFKNLKELADESDIIFLTTPVDTFKDIISQINKDLDKQILVDFGSVKCGPFKVIDRLIENKSVYVPAHPICGGRSIDIKDNLEKEIETIESNIFKGHLIHFFPENSNHTSMKIIENIFDNLGAEVNEKLTLEEHDKIYALTSHLPTFLSFSVFLSNRDYGSFFFNYFISKVFNRMWYSVFTENIDNIEFWLKKINNFLLGKSTVSALYLGDGLKNLVYANKLEKYTGKGYLLFTSERSKKSCCNFNDFVENQNRLLFACKNGNLENLFKNFIN